MPHKDIGNIRKKTMSAIAVIAVMALSWFRVSAEELTVSLVTCYPGPEIYELCGHEAIRVRSAERDSVWNFGMFNFREPNFVWRFVKGETDYECAGYPFAWFLPEYVARGSRVVEQDLNLTQEEARQVLAALRKHALPENRRYRYNYVKDNCATRILDQLDHALGTHVLYPDTTSYASFRDEMRCYHRNYPWYQFGIDLALGSGIDYKISGREDMFVPVEMMRKVGNAHLPDGRPLVKSTRTLFEGTGEAVLPPTPWYATPLFVSWALAVAVGAFCCVSIRKKRIYGWAWSLWFGILGIAGTVVAFLVFVSSHEATSPNSLILWLNPLQLLFAVSAPWRRLRPLAIGLSIYDIVVPLCMLIVWPFQRQSANPAFFPLLLSTLILSSSYAIIAYKESYKRKSKKK